MKYFYESYLPWPSIYDDKNLLVSYFKIIQQNDDLSETVIYDGDEAGFDAKINELGIRFEDEPDLEDNNA